MSKGALAFIAGLGTGYLNQRNREEDRARQERIDRIAIERADREQIDFEDKHNLKRAVAEASKPGEIKYENVAYSGIPLQSAEDLLPGESAKEPQQVKVPLAAQGLGASTRKITFNGKEYATPDDAKADIAAYNKPEATNSRVLQAYRNAGDHAAALDLEGKSLRLKGDTAQTEAAQMQLQQAKEQEARLTFGRGMVNAYSSGGGAGLMSFLSDSHADGEAGAVKFEQKLSSDGKVATVYKTNSKGEKLKVGDVPNTDEGWQSAMFRLQRGLDPNALFAHSAALKKQELEERKVAATERKADADARRADASERKTDALISGVIGARGINGKQKEDAPIWDTGADKTLVGLFTRKDELGNESIDSDGILFAKKIGVGLASQNGGDSFTAAHQAATIDSKLRTAAGNDPKKLAELRANYIRQITTPKSSPNNQN